MDQPGSAATAPPGGAPSGPLTIALDACGADGGPEVIAAGAEAVAAEGIRVRAFGLAPELEELAGIDRVELRRAEDAISNEEEPVRAVHQKPRSSIVLAAQDVAEGYSHALVSAGSTGAALAAALFALRRLRGVHRPAIAVPIPLPDRPGEKVLLLDAGANAEVRPQHLVQFAYLGAAFSEAVLEVESPRVALLSVGEERGKGTPTVVAAHEALIGAGGISFTGNVEGRDVVEGAADVVVTDGFTGNVALKTMEGTAKAVGGAVRGAARSGFFAALGGLLMRRSLERLRRDLDPDTTGGAILLGLRGVTVVAHGSSGPEGIANAIRLAERSARERVVLRTAELLERSGASRAAVRASLERDRSATA
ncbi:MAG TPA: phosphate acyltransferase PlsX [Solirubrobacterales bacterium]|nr:phosphate acyltransferase PlsX [Solirubrobacterales bacterium]